MKFQMEITKLSKMMATAIKGSGNGKFLPITAYANIVLKEGVLSITCTNSTTYMTVKETGVVGEDGACIVHADKLNKLIQKTTVKDLKFEQKENMLVIKGNGTYRLEILNEKYPTYDFNSQDEGITVKVSDLKGMFNINKYAISKDMSTPYLTGYNIGERCITTDGVKMCINELNITKGGMLLIPQELADLLESLEGEEVTIQHDENKLLFSTKTATVFGSELSDKESYPDITGILNFEYKYNVEVKKSELIAVLDRILIFTNPFDNNGVKIVFGKEGLQVSDIKENNVEVVKYTKPVDIEQTEVLVNIAFLMGLISAIQTDVVNIYFGNDACIKIEEGKVTEVLSLMSADE